MKLKDAQIKAESKGHILEKPFKKNFKVVDNKIVELPYFCYPKEHPFWGRWYKTIKEALDDIE